VNQDSAPTTRTMTVILVLVVLACLAGLWAMGPEPATDDLHVYTTCEEDMPCWDCETMGNRICGLQP
jgi:hypothetical protein